MRIRVLMFGPIADAVGRDEVVLELAEGARAGDVAPALRERHPELVAGGAHALAVNATYAEADRPLVDGDEVALIPPVSGG